MLELTLLIKINEHLETNSLRLYQQVGGLPAVGRFKSACPVKCNEDGFTSSKNDPKGVQIFGIFYYPNLPISHKGS
jgi:hypothetical protein